MVDYSKWDKFERELSEDDDEANHMPGVTQFSKEGGESISIGPNGYEVVEKSAAPPAVSRNPLSKALLSRTEDRNHSSSPTPSELAAKELKALESKNGRVCENYSWSQDKYEVVITVPLDTTIKAKDLQVALEDRNLFVRMCAGGTSAFQFPILSGPLRYAVELSDVASEQGCPFDWEIKTKPSGIPNVDRKVMEIVLKKKSPIPGAVIWWENVFEDGPRIDVTTIEGRNMSSTAAVNDTWAEAQKAFADRIASNPPEKIEVEC